MSRRPAPESEANEAVGGQDRAPVSRNQVASHRPDWPSLYDVGAVLGGREPVGLDGETTTALQRIARWLENFVSRPNPELGRSGDVCPWTRHAIDIGRLLLVPMTWNAPAEVDEILLQLLGWFSAMSWSEGADATYRAIIAVFHRLDPTTAAAFIVATHARLKPTFLDRGLMLGEFYATCDKPGLRSRDFRPLRSPIPLLVIRPMVEADIEFLLDRDEFVEAYLRTHGKRGIARLARVVEQGPPGMTPERRAQLLQRARALPA